MVGQLLDHSAGDARELDVALHESPKAHTLTAFLFFPKDGDVVSPCSSISVTAKRQKYKKSEPYGSRVVVQHWVSSTLTLT